MVEIWQKLRSRRRELDITQEEVAEYCGVTKGAVALWESKDPKKRNVPRKNKLTKLAQVLDVPVEWFIDENAELSTLRATIADVEEDEYQASKMEAESEERSMQVILELNNLSLMGKLTKEDIQILEALVSIAKKR